mgnify:FL=1
MYCSEAGHVYKLSNALEPSRMQEVKFIKRVNGQLVSDGTTNEEVLGMLIDRVRYLNTELPCRENALVITKLEESLMWLEKRTALRVAQGVETLDKAHKS